MFLQEACQAARLARHLLSAEVHKGNSEAALDMQVLETLEKRLGAMPEMGTIRAALTLLMNRKKRAGDATAAVSDVIDELSGGIYLLDALLARRFHRTIFRILPNREKACHAWHEPDQKKEHVKLIAEFFCDPGNRWITEAAIENAAQLPKGTVVIHCPPYGGPAKVAEVLLLARGPSGVEECKPFKDAEKLQDEMFAYHVEAVKALEAMYWSTWRLTVSVAPPHFLEWESLGKSISGAMEKILIDYKRFTTIELGNDPAMVAELKMATERAKQPEEVDTGRASDLQPAEVATSDYRPIVYDDVEPLLSLYGIRRDDRLLVRQDIIPEFLKRARQLVNDHPERWPRLAKRLLARRPHHSLQLNRVDAEQIRRGLNRVLMEFERDLNNGEKPVI